MVLIFKRIWDFITTKRDFLYIIGIIILSLSLIGQCDKSSELKHEVNRLENNIYAITDTLTQYQDENDRIIAEKHAYQLTEKELRDSVDLLKIKNREYLSYINMNIGIKDTLQVPTYIERPTEIDSTYIDKGIIKFNKSDIFGKSSREVSVSIPYTFNTKLYTGTAELNMFQNIYVESMLERDKKTGETYVRLMSDYPNLKFNDGMGIVVSNSSSYEKSIRKTKGFGFTVGPSVGVNYDIINHKIVPTVGFNITFGWTYTPKWTQY